ncbi:MAG: STAS/SEC14 domain-containing protein [Bacteroidales bacterium]
MENTMTMQEVTIVDESYAKVTYVPDYELIKLAWKGQISSENYRKIYNIILDYQKNNSLPVTNYLADLRAQGVVNPNDRKWFETVAMPTAIEQGLKHAAVITDANIFKKYYLNLILKASNKFGLPLKMFGTHEEALKWFDSFKS